MNFKDLLMKAAKHGVAQVLGVILFLGGAGIGVSMLTAPNLYRSYSALKANFEFLGPGAWGTMFLLASLALVITVIANAPMAQLPALALGVLFLVFGLFALASAASAIVWAFVALGWVSIFTQVICWAEDKREAPTLHHQPQ